MEKVWLIYPYGQIHGESGRMSRYNLFGHELSESGFEVIWWTANFNHTEKKFRTTKEKIINVNEKFSTFLVPTCSYKKNVSIGRLIFEDKYAKNLKKEFRKREKPDLIIVAGTGIFNAFQPCRSYAKENRIPIIYDIMDIPLIETYFVQKNAILGLAAKIVMAVERKKETSFFKYVSGITALGKNQLKYAKKRAYNRNIPAELIYNGNDVKKIRLDMSNNSCKYSKEKDWVWCVFSGALGPSYDIDTLIKCANLFRDNGDKIRIFIAGNGPQKDNVVEASINTTNLDYVGFLPMDELAGLYSKCDIGLCAFSSYSTVDMPDKFYDYCAAGLAIINSLNGEVNEYIEDKGLGLKYEAGNELDLYNKIKMVAQDDQLNTYKQNSYDMGMEFDAKNQMKKLVSIVDSVLHDS